MISKHRLVMPAVAAMLAACAYSHLEQPELAVVDVELVHGDVFQQQLRVRMSVHNPNQLQLNVRRVDYAVELDGKPFAHGVSSGDFVVPPNGDTQFDVDVTANAAAAVLHLLGSQQNPAYRIHGKVLLSSGMLRSIAFDHSGQIRLH